MSRAARIRIVLLVAILALTGGAAGAHARKLSAHHPRAARQAPSPRPPLHVYTLLDAQGDGRIHYTRRVPAGGILGTADVVASLPQGLAVGRARLTLPAALNVLAARAFARATANHVEGIGTFEAPAPGEGGRIDGRLSLHQDSRTSHVVGSWTSDLPVSLAALPLQSFDLVAGAHGTWSAGESRLHVAVRGSAIRQDVALDQVKLDWSDDGEHAAFSATVRAPHRSWLARQIAPFMKDPDKWAGLFKSNLSAVGIPVTAAAVTVPPATAGSDGIRLELKTTGLHEALAAFLTAMAKQFAKKNPTLPTAVEEMLQLRVVHCGLDVTRVDDDLQIEGRLQAQHVDRFMIGYLGVLDAFYRMGAAAALPTRGSFDKLQARVAMSEMAHLIPLLKLVYSSPGRSDFDCTMRVENAAGHLKGDGQLRWTMDVAALEAALKAHGYPYVDRQDARLTLLCDGTHLDGRAWLDETGPWFEALRQPYAQAAREDKDLQFLLPLVADSQLQDARWNLQIEDGRVTSDGYLQTTPLDSALAPLVKAAAPELDVDAAGAELHWIHRGGRRATVTADLYARRLDSAKVPRVVALLQSVLHAPVRNTLRPGSDRATVEVPTLAAPTVERPAGLPVLAPPTEKKPQREPATSKPST